MVNAFTVDLEDWFCPYNLSNMIRPDEWDSAEFRIVEPSLRILSLLRKYNVKATFFVLGWIAKKVPDLIKKIENEGHEIACHGYYHNLLTEVDPLEFTSDLEMALDAIEKCTCKKIGGYRAPVFSIVEENLWVLDFLKDYGFKYDSSIYPFKLHPDYGIRNAELCLYHHSNSLLEIPMSCARIGNLRIPCSGGGYFRLFPYCVFRKLFKKCNNEGRPVIFYMHPWEIDTGQPRLKLNAFDKFRHYQNISRTYSRLKRLLEEFEFTSIEKLFNIT